MTTDFVIRTPAFPFTCTNCGEKMMCKVDLCGPCEDARRKERERLADVRKRLQVIPKRYQSARFGDPCIEQRVADHRAVDVAGTALAHHTVVIFQGVPGTGKTTLAAAVLAQEAELGRTVAWVTSMRLAVARSEARLGAEPQEVRDAIRAGVTVIDDLGNEAIVTTSAIGDVIFTRHDAERPLVITTGLSRLEIAGRYGGGSARRLLEAALVIECGVKHAPDRRS